MNVHWPVAVPLDSPFPLNNIPFGVFSSSNLQSKRVGSAIGDFVLDLSILESHGCFRDIFDDDDLKSQGHTNQPTTTQDYIFAESSLNKFASLPSHLRKSVRSRIINLLEDEKSPLFTDQGLNIQVFYDRDEVQMHLPMQIGDFTDFMGSRVHVENCSALANTVPHPSFYNFPPAYNGRSSSIIVSGTSFSRPKGMVQNIKSSSTPSQSSSMSLMTPTFTFSPSQRMDYELELGFFISTPVPFGEVIKSLGEAKEHIFGFVLLNDWSARDVQFAEMTPLGPFNGKGSATTISPWVVTLDAFEGAECGVADAKSLEDMVGRPDHMSYHDDEDRSVEVNSGGNWDIEVEVWLGRKREGGKNLEILGRSNLKELYWSPLQMLSHHASSGCGLRTGDLMGTGTISSSSLKDGDETSGLGCLLERTGGGMKHVKLSNGEKVTWLEDNDEVVLRGRVKLGDGSVIGFGDCSGVLNPAVPNA